MRQRTVRIESERRYPISAAEAWRLLADTDHLNRTVGLPPVEFSALPDPLLRSARAKAFGVLPVRWKEFPFEWIRERRYVVRREFESGPVSAAEIGIELTPGDHGVIVKSFAELTAPSLAGPLLKRLGLRPVAQLLDFCDRYLARKAEGRADPLPAPRPSSPPDREVARERLARLRRCPVRPELVAALEERILEGSDDEVLRVRPFAVAELWGAERLEVLRLFLYATRCGMFELRWELMCPNCRVPKDEVGSLSELPVRFHCELCGISYGADFDRSVELRFSIHPAVRHAADQVYCIGGPLRMPHIMAQQYLRPGEERALAVASGEPLDLRAVGSGRRLRIAAGPARERQPEVKVTYADGAWTAPHSLTADNALALPQGSALVLRNQTGGPILAVVEDAGWTRDATTAAEVTTLSEFRDLFSSEVLAPDQQHAIRHIALLFSDLKGSTRLYEGIGDAAAYGRVNRHFEFIKQAAARRDGTIVKTMGDGVMCAFTTLAAALDTALGLQAEVEGWCRAQQIDPPLVLKIGVHAGPVIAMTANDRLDYFGRTVNLAARLGNESEGGDVVLLEEAFHAADERVAADGMKLSVEPFTARMRGLEGEQRAFRLRLQAPDVAAHTAAAGMAGVGS